MNEYFCYLSLRRLALRCLNLHEKSVRRTDGRSPNVLNGSVAGLSRYIKLVLINISRKENKIFFMEAAFNNLLCLMGSVVLFVYEIITIPRL